MLAIQKMNNHEELELRAMYRQWPTIQLARAATVERHQYRPDALPLIDAELKSREVIGDSVHPGALIAPAPKALLPIKDTWAFPAKLRRRQYLIRWVIWLAVVIGLGATFEMVPVFQPYGFGAIIVVGVVYRLVGLDLPRLRSIGWSPWVLALFLVPPVNICLLVLLFIAPPESQK